MEFPTILYKCPGPWSGNGYSFSTCPANDQGQYDAARASGWHPTVPEAVAAWKSPASKAAPDTAKGPEPSLNAAPTRAEIEQKAKELGISVHHKHSDATLLKKIDEALAPKEPAGDVDKA